MYQGAGKPIPYNDSDFLESNSRKSALAPLAFLVGFGGAAYLGWYLYNTHRAQILQRTRSQVKESKSEPVSSFTKNKTDNVEDGSDINSNVSSIRAQAHPNIKVIIHQCPRGYMTPCIAPFPLKLETFLRVSSIPYEVDFSITSEDRNTPWMTVGDEEMSESHECITKLSELFNVNLEGNAQNSRVIASRLVGVVLENHIYWGIALWRWVYDEGKTLPQIQPLSPSGMLTVKDIGESVSRASWYHGLGRLSPKQVADLILKDLGDLSVALGKHSYFLGDSPGEVDCAAFSLLSQMIWNMPASPFEAGIKQYRNLVDFVLRMRDNYWPDWQTLLQVRGQEVVVSAILPGSEFLDKKQFNSDSSQWDSKTSSSTATLKDLPRANIQRRTRDEVRSNNMPEETSVTNNNEPQETLNDMIEPVRNQNVTESVEMHPIDDNNNQNSEPTVKNPVSNVSIRNYCHRSGSNRSFHHHSGGQPLPRGILRPNPDSLNIYFPQPADLPQDTFLGQPAQNNNSYPEVYSQGQLHVPVALNDLQWSENYEPSVVKPLSPCSNHANVMNKIMAHNTNVTTGSFQTDGTPIVSQQRYIQNQQGIFDQTQLGRSYLPLQDNLGGSSNDFVSEQHEMYAQRELGSNDRYFPQSNQPNHCFHPDYVNPKPQYLQQQNQQPLQQRQGMMHGMSPQQQQQSIPGSRVSAHRVPVPQQHQMQMRIQHQHHYPQQHPNAEGMMQQQLQPRY